MGPEFPLQRAVWISGHMWPDPPTAGAGDAEDYAPGDPRRAPRPECVVGRPTCYEGGPAEGDDG